MYAIWRENTMKTPLTPEKAHKARPFGACGVCGASSNAQGTEPEFRALQRS